jgi:hypothetical protein
MSTTFGVEIINDAAGIGEVVEVAFRSNGMRFINPLAHLLPDDTPVIALDNTSQGVYTIGDIKVAITKTEPDAEYWRTIKI